MVEENGLGSKLFDAFNVFMMILLTILCILPMWYILMVSLSEKAAVAAGSVGLWPIGFNIISYTEIMGDPQFLRSFWNSIQRVVIGGGLTVFCTVLMAYPLSKTPKELPYRNAFMWVLVFCMLFSGGLIPWYITMKNFGVIDTIWGLALGGGLNVFNVILVVNFFRNLPKELEEAAYMDGAGPWYILFQLFIPISVPVIATVTLFALVYQWNEFFNGLVLTTSSENYPLQTYIQQLVVNINPSTMNIEEVKRLSQLSNKSLNAAKIFIAMIPILSVYPFLQKYFIHGITLGSVKE